MPSPPVFSINTSSPVPSYSCSTFPHHWSLVAYGPQTWLAALDKFSLYWPSRANWAHLFPTPHLVRSSLQLDVYHGGGIYTAEIGKHSKLGLWGSVGDRLSHSYQPITAPNAPTPSSSYQLFIQLVVCVSLHSYWTWSQVNQENKSPIFSTQFMAHGIPYQNYHCI